MDVVDIFNSHLKVIELTMKNQSENVGKFARICTNSLKNNNCIFFMGNGGSAADSQHLAAEFVGRFQKERRGYSSIALTTDTSVLTSIANDYDFNKIFQRQVQALANQGDVVVGISTSGNSANIIEGIIEAKKVGTFTVGLLGKDGGALKDLCDLSIVVPSNVTARIQEAHILIGHIVCELVEREMDNE